MLSLQAIVCSRTIADAIGEAMNKTTTVDATASGERTFEKRSPVTGEPLGTFTVTDREGVEAAVARARAAFPTWRDTPLRERLRVLARIKDIVRTHGEEYARRISDDTGKPLVDSLLTELMSIPLFIDHYRKVAPRTLGRRRVKTPILFPGKSSYMAPFPMGVVAVISPWNFPFQLSMVPVISALIAGNTVVLKPSEVTPTAVLPAAKSPAITPLSLSRTPPVRSSTRRPPRVSVAQVKRRLPSAQSTA